MSPRRHYRGISNLVVAGGGGEELSEQAREWSEAEAEVVSPSTVIAACPAGKCDAIRPIPIGRAGPGTPCSVRRLLCLSSEALFTPSRFQLVLFVICSFWAPMTESLGSGTPPKKGPNIFHTRGPENSPHPPLSHPYSEYKYNN